MDQNMHRSEIPSTALTCVNRAIGVVLWVAGGWRLRSIARQNESEATDQEKTGKEAEEMKKIWAAQVELRPNSLRHGGCPE
eukprot:260957-Amphidinium_carterae.1